MINHINRKVEYVVITIEYKKSVIFNNYSREKLGKLGIEGKFF